MSNIFNYLDCETTSKYNQKVVDEWMTKFDEVCGLDIYFCEKISPDFDNHYCETLYKNRIRACPEPDTDFVSKSEECRRKCSFIKCKKRGGNLPECPRTKKYNDEAVIKLIDKYDKNCPLDHYYCNPDSPDGASKLKESKLFLFVCFVSMISQIFY